MAIALSGVVVVVATILAQNRQNKPVATSTKSFIEPVSGIAMDAPQSWSIGSVSTNTLVSTTYRVASIPTQRTTCTAFSPERSKTIQTALAGGESGALSAWQQEFPGLVTGQIIKGPSTLYGLVGIDTCTDSLTVRTITFRGQAYKNNVEVQLSHVVPLDDSLSATDVSQLAQALADGNADPTDQTVFNQFVAVLGSVR